MFEDPQGTRANKIPTIASIYIFHEPIVPSKLCNKTSVSDELWDLKVLIMLYLFGNRYNNTHSMLFTM